MQATLGHEINPRTLRQFMLPFSLNNKTHFSFRILRPKGENATGSFLQYNKTFHDYRALLKSTKASQHKFSVFLTKTAKNGVG